MNMIWFTDHLTEIEVKYALAKSSMQRFPIDIIKIKIAK